MNIKIILLSLLLLSAFAIFSLTGSNTVSCAEGIEGNTNAISCDINSNVYKSTKPFWIVIEVYNNSEKLILKSPLIIRLSSQCNIVTDVAADNNNELESTNCQRAFIKLGLSLLHPNENSNYQPFSFNFKLSKMSDNVKSQNQNSNIPNIGRNQDAIELKKNSNRNVSQHLIECSFASIQLEFDKRTLLYCDSFSKIYLSIYRDQPNIIDSSNIGAKKEVKAKIN